MKQRSSNYTNNPINKDELQSAQNALRSLKAKNAFQNSNQARRQNKPNLLMNQDKYSLNDNAGEKHLSTEGSSQMAGSNMYQNNIGYGNLQNGYRVGNTNVPKTTSTGRRPLMANINFGGHNGNLPMQNYGMNAQRNYNNAGMGYNKNSNMNSNYGKKAMMPMENKEDERPLDKGENLDKTKEQSNPEKGEETFECESCGRKFVREALEKHYKVCQKVFNEKREKFDSKKNRILDSEHAIMLKNAEYKEKKEARMNKDKNKNKVQGDPKWKKQSEEFRSIIKGGEDGAAFKPSVLTEDYQLCQFCNRKYNDEAYKKHLPTCERKYKEAQMKAKASKGKQPAKKK